MPDTQRHHGQVDEPHAGIVDGVLLTAQLAVGEQIHLDVAAGFLFHQACEGLAQFILGAACRIAEPAACGTSAEPSRRRNGNPESAMTSTDAWSRSSG